MPKPRNKTLNLTPAELQEYTKQTKTLRQPATVSQVLDSVFCQDAFEVLDLLPPNFVDLLIVDPPYNLNKQFGQISFKKSSVEDYNQYLNSFFMKAAKLLKPNASLYICGDWLSSVSIYQVACQYFQIQNRITWQREKGRGSKTNWKNAHEDLWFCTNSQQYTFNVSAVKLRRKVLAPYTENGQAKDWFEDEAGKFRDTHPSNFWDDLTIPYWSMSENTKHPTQKPEKLIAKLILASSNPNDVVFDPFLGSGSTVVVAKKLGRRYVGVELDPEYACLSLKRLQLADANTQIQGYQDQVFWERNSQPNKKKKPTPTAVLKLHRP